MDRHIKALEILHSGTVIPANPLSLDENRQFDEHGQRLLTKYYLEAGAGGIAAAVHTTQFEIRLPQYNLFEKVLRVTAAEISNYEKSHNKTIVRIAGVCGNVEQAISEAAIAKQCGYDAVLLSPGGLNDLSEKEMINRTKAVAEIMPVIGFYLQTAVGGRVFTFNYWQQICEIDNVVAIKCASFNRYTTADVARAATLSSRADKIALYTGNDDNIVIDLITKYRFEIGGKTYETRFAGGLLGHWSVWTHSAVLMFEYLKAQAEKGVISEDVLTLAAQITDVNGVFFDVANNFKGCIAGLHEVLRRQGLMRGIWCLNPDEAMSKGQAEEIDRVYKMYPQLNDDAFIKENICRWVAELEKNK
ncbi:MAG: dihydrodipicolinate synthase family protein [Christensenella sp.]